MKKTQLQAAIAIGLLVALFTLSNYYSAHTSYSEAVTIGQNVTSFKELSDRFAALAKNKGAVYAFDVLKIADVPPNTDLHLLGHTVGEILYQQQGVDGIQYCTQDFRNACSHTIAIGALNEYGGAGALPRIHDACKKAPGGAGAYTMCYHGLGHGVFAYYNYDLAKTVAFCKKTGTAAYHDQEYAECVGGSIMELIGGGGHDHDDWVIAQKKYLTNDPLSPCMDSVIPDDVKSLCLIYLTPELFVRAGADLANPDPSTFPKAFSYCDAISKNSQHLRDACFGGFGKEFIVIAGSRDIRHVDSFTTEQYRKAIDWCGLSDAQDGKEACITQTVASVFWGGENNPDAAFTLCSLMTGDLQSACYKSLATEINHYVSGAKGSELCARLPEQFKKQCIVSGSSL